MSPRPPLLRFAGPALAALAMALGAGAARAEPGPIVLASTNGFEQANNATSPALSADGHYLAFSGSIGPYGGIFRKDLTTGEVVPVAARPISEREGQGADGIAPSISADGRFISFTTTEPLDPTDDPEPRTSDVYVADMSTAPPTYTLVSARDESNQGLTYGGTNPSAGSLASSRSAISADGNEVVFVTVAASDLTGEAGAAETPALQVAVRDVAARRTILISAARDPASGAMQPTTPIPGGGAFGLIFRLPGATISADGTTVAWIGTHIAAQAAIPAVEAPSVAALESQGGEEHPYTEPLWRAVPTPSDPAPPTRRMVSAAVFPALISGENQKLFTNCTDAVGWDINSNPLLYEITPSLSADGKKVVLVGEPEGYTDAYLFDLSGEPTVRRLTRAIAVPQNLVCEANNSAYEPGSALISSVAISPDGERVALTTNRQRFPLSPPVLVGSPPLRVGLPELYLLDLKLGTMQRLTGGPEGEPSLSLPPTFGAENGATSVSFDAAGETLAFTSRASNLVPGDGNGELGGSDAFLVSDPRDVPKAGTSVISRRPPQLRTTPRRILTARATSRPDGSVRVAVSVPAAGRLTAVANTEGRKGVKARRVALARRHPLLASTVAFNLVPGKKFGKKLRVAGGVEAKLRLQFRGSEGNPLQLFLHVRFHVHAKRPKGARR